MALKLARHWRAGLTWPYVQECVQRELPNDADAGAAAANDDDDDADDDDEKDDANDDETLTLLLCAMVRPPF